MARDIAQAKHFYWLDWLRFAAALAVVLCHARPNNWTVWADLDGHYKNWLTGALFSLMRVGVEAVVVFFVLSGFLVGGKVLDRMMKGSFDIRAYAVDRASRLYLPLIPAMLLTVIVSLVCGDSVSIAQFIGNLLNLQGLFCIALAGNGPLWSLAYEFWFYVLAGFVALAWVASGRTRALAICGTMLVFVVFTRLDSSLLFCWCLGAISYRLLSQHPARWSLYAGILLSIMGYGLSQALSLGVAANSGRIGSFFLSGPVAMLVLSLGLALVLPYLAQKEPRSHCWCSFERTGTTLAAFSYTLYLTHAPVLTLWSLLPGGRFNTVSIASVACFIAKISSCVLVAWLLYLPFEAQTNRVRSWLRSALAKAEASDRTRERAARLNG